MSPATLNDRFLDVVGVALAAKLHAQLGDRTAAVEELSRLQRAAERLRAELLAGEAGAPR